MNELNTILEKISTLNVNANTNIDIQKIVEQYVLFDAIKNVSIALIFGLTILTIAYMIYRVSTKSVEGKRKDKVFDDLEKALNSVDDWRKIKDLQLMIVTGKHDISYKL